MKKPLKRLKKNSGGKIKLPKPQILPFSSFCWLKKLLNSHTILPSDEINSWSW